MNKDELPLILFVSDDASFLQEALRVASGDLAGRLRPEVSSFRKALNGTDGSSPAFVVVDVGVCDEAAVKRVSAVCEHLGSSIILGSARHLNAETILHLLKMGVRDFLAFPFREAEISELVMRMKPSGNGQNAPERQGRMITLFGPKGGAGVTLLTVNLAVALAQKNKSLKVAVADIHPQCGDVATYLNMPAKHTLRDLIDHYDLLDKSFLSGVMMEHETGIRVLAAPRDDQEPIRPECLQQLKSVISLLKESSDVILVDGGHSEAAVLNMLLEQSDTILLVGNLDVPSLKGLISCFNQLVGLRLSREKIKIVINRCDAKNRIDVSEFEKKTKHPVSFRLPNSYALSIDAINTGRPIRELQKGSVLTQKIDELASVLHNGHFGNSTLFKPPKLKAKQSVLNSARRWFQ